MRPVKHGGWAIFIAFFVCITGYVIVGLPELLVAMNRRDQKRTMADMRDIGNALDARAGDLKTYAFTAADRQRPRGAIGDLTPLRRVSYEELERALKPRYMKEVPRYDRWGNEIEVRVARDAYAIRSPGKDDRTEGERYQQRTISDFKSDIVYTDGTFLTIPEGVSTY